MLSKELSVLRQNDILKADGSHCGLICISCRYASAGVDPRKPHICLEARILRQCQPGYRRRSTGLQTCSQGVLERSARVAAIACNGRPEHRGGSTKLPLWMSWVIALIGLECLFPQWVSQEFMRLKGLDRTAPPTVNGTTYWVLDIAVPQLVPQSIMRLEPLVPPPRYLECSAFPHHRYDVGAEAKLYEFTHAQLNGDAEYFFTFDYKSLELVPGLESDAGSSEVRPAEGRASQVRFGPMLEQPSRFSLFNLFSLPASLLDSLLLILFDLPPSSLRSLLRDLFNLLASFLDSRSSLRDLFCKPLLLSNSLFIRFGLPSPPSTSPLAFLFLMNHPFKVISFQIVFFDVILIVLERFRYVIQLCPVEGRTKTGKQYRTKQSRWASHILNFNLFFSDAESVSKGGTRILGSRRTLLVRLEASYTKGNNGIVQGQ
ncbi:uncharacterized protein BDR25DRAFT_363343 [Lindgomyces ingoldianus]|uniref:Uncharacterized protein n=1 Tax=Lindgomyces ingoldianus TaxID=673940 RepID=A0ACB6Q7M2_9PLEO|nr:uncharacterized protein BDR25DRAFT_363343 [Lindgomyces ingoldianus]KAF2462928.1 hypothetical protein BDR25DRAFT_363343 [Lindgomyces ingoldianus]